MQQSFFEKLQNNQVGKRGIVIAISTLLAVGFIKWLIAPQIANQLVSPMGKGLYKIINLIDSLAITNFIIFMLCIVFLQRKLFGQQLIFAMQTKEPDKFKPKWMLYWLNSLGISFVVLAITTILLQAFFKDWSSFVWLCVVVVLSLAINSILKITRR